MFDDSKYNYSTEINGTEEEIRAYFIGQVFNLGCVNDDMQKCINIEFLD